MLMTTNGILIRIAVSDISRMGRNTKGVKLIRLSGDHEHVATVAKVPREEEKELEGNEEN